MKVLSESSRPKLRYFINGFEYGKNYFMHFGFSDNELKSMFHGNVIEHGDNEFYLVAEDEYGHEFDPDQVFEIGVLGLEESRSGLKEKYLKLYYRLEWEYDDGTVDNETYNDLYEATLEFDDIVEYEQDDGVIAVTLYEVEVYDYARGEKEETLIKEWSAEN